MDDLVSKTIQCPSCWESIDVLIDPSVESQEYIEDCQVCCRPINFVVTVLEDSFQTEGSFSAKGSVSVQVYSDDHS